MAKFNKKRIVAEAVASSAGGGPWTLFLMKFMPRRWHIGTLVALLAVLMALGIVRLKWTGDEPGVQIDLKRSAEVGRDAKELLKAAKERLQKNG